MLERVILRRPVLRPPTLRRPCDRAKRALSTGRSRPGRLLRGRRSFRRCALAGRRSGLLGESGFRNRAAAFAFQGLERRLRTFSGLGRRLAAPRFAGIAQGLRSRLLGNAAPFRRRQIHSRASRLGQADRNGLPRRARPVGAVTDQFDFLAHKVARLRGRRFRRGSFWWRMFCGVIFPHNTVFRASNEPRRPKSYRIHPHSF